jgi:hypothetical protein
MAREDTVRPTGPSNSPEGKAYARLRLEQRSNCPHFQVLTVTLLEGKLWINLQAVKNGG